MMAITTGGGAWSYMSAMRKALPAMVKGSVCISGGHQRSYFHSSRFR